MNGHHTFQNRNELFELDSLFAGLKPEKRKKLGFRRKTHIMFYSDSAGIPMPQSGMEAPAVTPYGTFSKWRR